MNEEKAWGLFSLHIGAILGEHYKLYGMHHEAPIVMEKIKKETQLLVNNLNVAKNAEKTREHASGIQFVQQQ